MAVTLTCFVCQSTSESADSNNSRRRRRKTKTDSHQSQYNKLDLALWKIFCKYFYPPPLIGLGLTDSTSTLTSSSSVHHNLSNGEEEEAVAGPLPVFCPACCQTISNLFNLHLQLELIQSQISKIVAQVSVTFVQTENQENENDCDENLRVNLDKNYRIKQECMEEGQREQCEDNVIYSMRRCIRQRYQPLVLVSRSDYNIPHQHSNRGGSCADDFDPCEFSPLPVPFPDDDIDDAHLNLDFFLSAPIKQEIVDEDSTLFTQVENQESSPAFNKKSPRNIKAKDTSTKNKNKNTTTSDLPIILKTSGKTRGGIKSSSKGRTRTKIVEISASESEDGGSEHESDSDYDPDSEDYHQPVKKRRKSAKAKSNNNISSEAKSNSKSKAKPKTSGKQESTAEKESDEQNPNPDEPQVPPKPKRKRNKIPLRKNEKDPKIGDNLFEHNGKWRYERRVNDRGKTCLCCLTCNKIVRSRKNLLWHINVMHVEGKPAYVRTKRIDDDHFIYDEKYAITRVTEPSGIFFKCETCGALKKSIENVKVHLRAAHIARFKWVCDVCGYSCEHKSRLLDHQEIHAETDKYICEECGKFFKSAKQLRNHKDSHLPQPFKCEVCGRTFVYRAGLNRHKKTDNHYPDTSGTPFIPLKCELCNREFVLEENFKRHQSSCQGKAKSMCDWCGGYFVRVDKHQRLTCKKRFDQPDPKIGFSEDIEIDTDAENSKDSDEDGETVTVIDSQQQSNNENNDKEGNTNVDLPVEQPDS